MTPADRAAIDDAGFFAGAPVDAADGYIHLSTPAQVAETAAKHFAGQRGLSLAAFGADGFGERLRWEPSRGGALFPHLYAPLEMRTALWVAALTLGPGGAHRFPDWATGAGPLLQWAGRDWIALPSSGAGGAPVAVSWGSWADPQTPARPARPGEIARAAAFVGADPVPTEGYALPLLGGTPL